MKILKTTNILQEKFNQHNEKTHNFPKMSAVGIADNAVADDDDEYMQQADVDNDHHHHQEEMRPLPRFIATAPGSSSKDASGKKTPATGNAVEFFTDAELTTKSVRDHYLERCARARQTPSPHLLQQLPASVEDIDEVASLDFRNCYLGSKGLETVYAVIAACHRAVHLNLSGVGLDAGNVLPLIAILKAHSGIRELVLSKNRLGTETVLKLCVIAYSRGLLYKVDVDDAWVVGPLQARLQRILDRNNSVEGRARCAAQLPARRFEQRPAFDLIKDAPTPPPEVAPEDVPIVPVMARIAHQLRVVMQRHSSSSSSSSSSGGSSKMRDLQAMFRPLAPGVCSVKSFMRVVKLLDVTAVENEFSIHEFSDLMGTTVLIQGEGRVVRFGKIMSALRDHVVIRHPRNCESETVDAAVASASAPATKKLRDILDDIFDSRAAILESCEMIDVDVTGTLRFDDFVVGMAAATSTPRQDAEALLCFWLEALGVMMPASNNNNSSSRAQLLVPFKALLESLEVTSNTQLPTTVEAWRERTPKSMREL